MSNTNASTRTNYFRVTNEQRLREIIAKCHSGEDTIDLFLSRKDEHGNQLYGFGCHSSLDGYFIPSEESENDIEEYDMHSFLCDLQEILPEGEAVIILEAGHEKLATVYGDAYIITNKDWKYISLKDAAVTVGQTLLNDPKWTTVCEY